MNFLEEINESKEEIIEKINEKIIKKSMEIN